MTERPNQAKKQSIEGGFLSRFSWHVERFAEDVAKSPRLALLLITCEVAFWQRCARARCPEFMTRDVVSVHPDAPIAEVGELLMRGGIRRVPVVEDGTVVGIISRRDLVRVLHDPWMA